MSFILSILLSWIGGGLGIALVLALAAFLFLRGLVRTAGLLCAAAAVWAVSTLIFQEGGAHVQRKVDAAVVAERERQAKAAASALDAARRRAELREAEKIELETKVAAYETELAQRPAAAQCIGSDADAERLRSFLR